MGTLEQQLSSLSPDQRRLVELWMRREQAQASVPANQIIPRRTSEPSPLSFAQQRLWLLHQLDPGSPAYNLRTIVRLSGQLDVAIIERSLNEIVQRHETLRTTFTQAVPGRDGEPLQVIAPRLNLALPLVTLDHLPPDEQNIQIHHLALIETEQPFDLEHGPLLRARLLLLGPNEYVLLLTMHHIISDGWSQGVQLRELMALYAAFVQDKPSPLAPLPIQYADYAQWQQQALHSSAMAGQLAFWKAQLGQSTYVLELPADRPRPPVTSYRGAWDYYTIPGTLLEQLKELSRHEGVTLFMTLLAAFNVLLLHHTGQTDLVVGTPVAGRNRSELEGLIGCFVNMLPLRTDLSGDPSFRELLQRVRGVTLGAYGNQDVPFEKLVAELQLERDMSRNPVFQVMFVLQNAPVPSLKSPALSLQPIEVSSTTSTLDLSLYVREMEHELLIRVEYSTDLFEAATIGRLMDRFHRLLTAIVASPQQRLSALPLLSAAEQQQLADWSVAPADYPQDLALHQLFEAQAACTPAAGAVICGEQRLSYADLNRRANQLAHHLRRLGIGPEMLVGVCMDRSAEMVVALLGILKAGAAFLPLDPAYPRERLAFMLADTGVSVVVAHSAVREALLAMPGAAPIDVLYLDTDWDQIAQAPSSNPAITVSPDQLAYVLYTSGSTGQPKGVAGLHRGILNRLHWMWQTYPFEAHEVGCHKSSLNFADSIWEIFGPLLQGVPLVSIPDAAVKDVQEFVDTLAQHQITRLVLVPSLLQVLLETYPNLAQRVPTLKYWTSSGEALPVALAQRFHANLPDAILLNLYGSSEVAADSIWCEVEPVATRQAIPIGRPVANTTVYLLDHTLAAVPIGVTGEIYVGGVGLARGYHDRPALTAERFIPDPFTRSLRPGGERLYKTGDLGRYRPDGTIEFLGRIDHQVKIRGFRIEPQEIEAVLEQHPDLREVAVIARATAAGDQQLVAYVVGERVPSGQTESTEQRTGEPRTGALWATQEPGDGTDGSRFSVLGSASVSELRAFLREKLPDYMIPAAFVPLEALPLTPNGKVDRRALESLDPGAAVRSEAIVAPRTAVEEVLAEMWARLLGREQISIHDNFFDLGGHSLKAAQVITRMRAAFKVNLPVRTLFEATTVATMAAQIVARETRPGQAEKIALALKQIKNMSAADRQQMLAQKRRAQEQP